MKGLVLEIANHAIVDAVRNNKTTWLPDLDDPKYYSMKDKQGVFTSIYLKLDHEKQLRGCIGLPYPIKPLAHAIAISARNSALKDPRFPKIQKNELQNLVIEVEVLSPIEEIQYTTIDELINQIEVGEHGLIVKYRGFAGLLLPKVAKRQSWSPDEFLEHTCWKAGLDKRCFEISDCQIFRFTSILYE